MTYELFHLDTLLSVNIEPFFELLIAPGGAIQAQEPIIKIN